MIVFKIDKYESYVTYLFRWFKNSYSHFKFGHNERTRLAKLTAKYQLNQQVSWRDLNALIKHIDE